MEDCINAIKLLIIISLIMQFMQERGELIPPDESLEIARKVKETYCYTCTDIVKVIAFAQCKLQSITYFFHGPHMFHGQT